MASNLAHSPQSDPVRSLDHIRPTQHKRSDGRTVGQVVKDAVVKHYGSVKAAAYALGEGAHLPRLDESLMMREFEAGKLGRLEADPAIKPVVAAALQKAFGADDPKARALQLIQEGRAVLDELAQYIAFAS